MSKLVLPIVSLLLLANSLMAQRKTLKVYDSNPNDRILAYHTDIVVEKSGLLHVTETIIIYNGDGRPSTNDGATTGINDDIKRGIVRDFPTKYYTRYNFAHHVPFRIVSIKKNGEPEPYHTEKLDNGVRLLIGESTRYLEKGNYTYTISYETDWQVIFHKDKDELYWNVNGTGWVFTADHVSCKIDFPEGSKIIESNCYTGAQGSTESICTNSIFDDNTINFTANGPLGANEGLTVAVSIKKGVLVPPGAMSKLYKLAADNLLVFIMLLAITLLLIVNYYYWNKYGRDPEGGAISPQFSPPQGISAPDAGYIVGQAYKPHLFAAAIVDLAVRKKLTLRLESEGWLFKSPVYHFDPPPSNARDDGFNADEYYGFDANTLIGQKAAKGDYNPTIAGANTNLEKKLDERFHVGGRTRSPLMALFARNDNYVVFGYLLLLALTIAGIFMLVRNFSPGSLIAFVALLLTGIVMQVLFHRWMGAYTPKGRELADHLLGFKMYLETTEQHIYNALNPPEMTLQLFEKYLPYAIALKVENEWASKFESMIETARASESGYNPIYHSHFDRNMSFGQFSQSISSGLSSTVASASTPPSSSGGGSGGGGFSGGGGGGGGGGGW